MSILNRIKNLFIISAPDEKPQKSSTALYNKVEIRQFMRRRLDIDQWRSALVAAENIYNPNRVPLYEIYNEIILDAHLSAVMEKRIRAIRNRTVQFIKKNGKPDPAISELISQPWFFDFLGYCMEAIFWGHSLIEITPKKDGSLAAILLPRQNVMPEKGIIMVNPYGGKADNQINYRQPPYTSYIIEVGDGKNLGILAKAAPIVIYKRFNMADWSTRNELFGMPMREIRYDPNMPHSKTQAEAAVREMGAAGYIVLPEGAQLILHHQNGSAGADTYALLDENLDKKLSKLVLGNTMTTEDGSSLAQAKVHADVEHEMNMADQVFVEYILNYQLKNLLAAQGFPTDKGYFKFDDTERLPMKDRYLIDTALAQTVPIDPDYFYQTYGVPPPKDKTPNKDLSLAVKKKDNASLSAPAQPHQGQCCQPILNLVIDNDKWQAILDQVAKAIYKGSITPGAMHPQLYQETLTALLQATKEGGIDIARNIDYATPDANFLGYLKNHISLFSAAKNITQLKQLTDMLTDSSGNLKSFAKFKEDATAVFTTYNISYLQAEYNHALACAQMGAQWQQIQQDEQDFPYLQYTTAADDRVRPQHAALNGVILPVNHSFWNANYPPNDWNCRCDVVQLTQNQAQKQGITPDAQAQNLKAQPQQEKYIPLFARNPGKDPYWFAQHNYFDEANEKLLQSLVNERRYRTEYNDATQWEKTVPYSPQTGGYVVTHKKHGATERKANIATATILAKHGRAVELLEEKKNQKNPDATLNFEIWEFKNVQTDTFRAVEGALRSAKKQAGNILLYVSGASIDNIIQGAINAVRLDLKEEIKNVSLLFNQTDPPIQFSRAEVISGAFKSKLAP